MTPPELSRHLSQLLSNDISLSAMIWGPPGIGKSSIVAAVAAEAGRALVDVRLSQLAPTDLRGLPMVCGTRGTPSRTEWCPPDFLPRGGKGVLFLDEFNMAPPAMQGIAQQLILDRRVGSYILPDGWVVWAAGNRREDRASVFEMPAPLANRFMHLELQPDLDSFKSYAIARGFSETLVAFLAARPAMLHKIDPNSPCWPSPRSWEMANRLVAAGLSAETAVGNAAWAEYRAFLLRIEKMPSIDRILDSDDPREPAPTALDVRFAACAALALRSRTARHAVRAFRWVRGAMDREWTSMLLQDLQNSMVAKGLQGSLIEAMQSEPAFQAFLKEGAELLEIP